MTLVLSIATPTFVAQASDRQLTRLDETIFDDQANKVIVVHCRDGRFVLGYTGLAFLPTPTSPRF